MEDNEHIDKYLKSSLDKYLVQPRSSSFDDIQKKMEKKKRKRFLIFLFPGLIILVGAISLFNLSQTSSKSLTQNREHQPSTIKNKTTKHSKTSVILNSETKIPASQSENETSNKNNKSQNRNNRRENYANRNKKETTLKNNLVPGTSADIAAFEKAELVKSRDLEVSDSLVKEEIDHLEMVFLFLLDIDLPKEPVLDSLITYEPVLAKEDSLRKKKRAHFLIGADYNPQLGSYQFPKNNYSPYDKSISFNYNFGIKAGIIIKEKLEVLMGLGFQQYKREIKDFIIPEPLKNDPRYSHINNINAGSYKNIYRYLDYSLEGNKLHTINSCFKIKTGIGFHMLQMTSWLYKPGIITVAGSGIYNNDTGLNPFVNKWLATVNVRTGLIGQLNKTIQFQLCPTLYYSLNSMYTHGYFMNQKSFGIGLECSLLLKIR